MFSKYLFGVFMFFLGLVLGLFTDSDLIMDMIPVNKDIAKGAILVVIVVFFFFLWRISERLSGDREKENQDSKTDTKNDPYNPQ